MSRLIDSLAKEEDKDDVPVITKPPPKRRMSEGPEPEPITREAMARAWAESAIARLRADSFTIDYDTVPLTSEDV